MKTFTIRTETVGTKTYEAETQAEAIRKHSQAFPSAGIIGIVETSNYRAHEDALDSLAEEHNSAELANYYRHTV